MYRNIKFIIFFVVESMESKTTNKAIKEVRELFNELRSNLSREEINRIRKELYKKEAVHNFLKEKDQESSLTNKEKKVLKNIDKYLKNISMHLKNLKKHFKKLQKYLYGMDCLFNEHNEEGYFLNNNINAFQEARKLFNERRSNLLPKETKRIRKELYKKEAS